jgi:hypothetical protein
MAFQRKCSEAKQDHRVSPISEEKKVKTTTKEARNAALIELAKMNADGASATSDCEKKGREITSTVPNDHSSVSTPRRNPSDAVRHREPTSLEMKWPLRVMKIELIFITREAK